MTIIRREALATIFSRRWAPPPPLMSRSCHPPRPRRRWSDRARAFRPAWSAAPRGARPGRGWLPMSARRRLRGHPARARPGGRRMLGGRAGAEPSRMPGCTSATARAAASRLRASMLMRAGIPRTARRQAARARRRRWTRRRARHDDAPAVSESPNVPLHACAETHRLRPAPGRASAGGVGERGGREA